MLVVIRVTMRCICWLFIFFISIFGINATLNSVWHYECKEGYCYKMETTNTSILTLSQAECNLICLDAAGIWPKPTGKVSIANLSKISIDDIFLETETGTPVSALVTKAFKIFTSQVNQSIFSSTFTTVNTSSVYIKVNVNNSNLTILKLNTDESYNLNVFQKIERLINVTVEAETFFGARHAFETLSQLIIKDDLRNQILMPSHVTISDKPVYAWRGITLDTSRNFVPPADIKKTLKAMAVTKMNTLHWHITDSQSFPYVSKSYPELSQYGAYNPRKTYDNNTIKSIISYARVRGIRVVPEFDAPAHVGEGWQKFDVVTCFNWQPWGSYCSEPPCGQFDPSKSQLYDILEGIYGDMLEQFGSEIFHMGGDEVNINCWNNTDNLKNWMINEKGWGLSTNDFIANVWGYFQSQAAQRLYKKAGKNIPIILWSSDLTSIDDVTSLLPVDKYYIQIWTTGYDPTIERLLDKNYTLILSNYDALYLDCGFGEFTNDGNNWCSPYKTWQQLYENKPMNVVGSRKTQILGGEAALWSETTGLGSMHSRIWPRASAFAEALWTEPADYWNEAQVRLLLHTERLVRLGIHADTLQPEWCFQNQQNCS